MRGFDGFEAAVAVLPWDIRRRALALSPGEYPVVGPGPRAEALDQGDLVLTMPEVREERPAPARRQQAYCFLASLVRTAPARAQ